MDYISSYHLSSRDCTQTELCITLFVSLPCTASEETIGFVLYSIAVRIINCFFPMHASVRNEVFAFVSAMLWVHGHSSSYIEKSWNMLWIGEWSGHATLGFASETRIHMLFHFRLKACRRGRVSVA